MYPLETTVPLIRGSCATRSCIFKAIYVSLGSVTNSSLEDDRPSGVLFIIMPRGKLPASESLVWKNMTHEHRSHSLRESELQGSRHSTLGSGPVVKRDLLPTD